MYPSSKNKLKILTKIDNTHNKSNNINITNSANNNRSSNLVELLKTQKGQRLSINVSLLTHGSLLEKAKQYQQPQNDSNIQNKKTDAQLTIPRRNSSKIPNQLEFLEKINKKINNEPDNNKNKNINEIPYKKYNSIKTNKTIKIVQSPVFNNALSGSSTGTAGTNQPISEKSENNSYSKSDFYEEVNQHKTVEYETVKDNYSIKQCNTVLEYSFREDINIDSQSIMEDKSKSIENFDNNKYQILFEIFDGHGGDDISSFLQQNFAKIYKQYLHINKGDIPKSLNNAFIDIDDAMKENIDNNLEGMGSTGTIVHIKWEASDIMMVYTGNIGDTKVCLISPMHIIKLSYCHDINDDEEKKRIKDGKIGNENLTRSFGDYEFKNDENGIISKPFLSKIKVDLRIKNQFLILGSKGIWEFIKEEDIQKMIRINNDTEKLCSLIIKKSLDLGAEDNLSVFVIKLT